VLDDAEACSVMIAIGVTLAVLAAALGTASKQLIATSEHKKKAWMFHLGAGLNIAVGPIVDASAYMYAPQVIVAPLACLDVILNAVTAPIVLRWQNEKLTPVHIAGIVLVTLGAVCTSVFAEKADTVLTVYDLEQQLFLRPTSLAYLGLELMAVLIVLLLMKRGKLGPSARGLSLGIAAGLLMGNVFFAKGLLSILRSTLEEQKNSGGFEAWLRPTPYLLLVLALSGPLCGHVLMRKGLAEYKGVFMVTIFEGAHISAACLSGCVVMEEMAGAPWWRYVLYWCGVLLILAGLLVINSAAPDARMEARTSEAVRRASSLAAQSWRYTTASVGRLRLESLQGSEMANVGLRENPARQPEPLPDQAIAPNVSFTAG